MFSKRIQISTYIEVAFHAAFWLVVISLGLNSEFTTSLEVSDSLDPSRMYYRLPISMFVFYSNFFFLSPLLRAKGIGLRLVSAFFLISLAAAFEAVIDGLQIILSAHAYILSTLFGLFLINFVVQTTYWFLSVLFRQGHDMVINSRLNQQLLEENTQIELALLKTQLNPHFLFNVLNTLYASSYEFGDASTASGINKLSKLLRYLLYETSDQFVSLESELDCLEDYNDLQKMRFTDDVTVNIRIEGEIKNWEIAPFLLVTLLENAYKHGIRPHKNSIIDIQLVVSETQLIFVIENDLLLTNKVNERTSVEGGLGLENLRRRLELLYPDAHELSDSVDGTRYITRLELK